jgi:hypothetical protein
VRTVAPGLLLALLGTVMAAASCGGGDPPPPRVVPGASAGQSSAEAERAFWDWFVANEAQLFAIESDPEALRRGLEGRLGAVHPRLTVDVGPLQAGKRELIIGAGGKVAAFETVRSLVAGAPGLPRWTVIALRPRRAPVLPVRAGELEVAPEQVEFALFPQGDRVGISLFFDPKVMEEPDTMRRVGFLLLDQALGEEDVTTRVGTIDWRPKDRAGARLTLVDLARTFDAAIADAAAR